MLKSWQVYLGVIAACLLTLLITGNSLLAFSSGALVTIYGAYLTMKQKKNGVPPATIATITTIEGERNSSGKYSRSELLSQNLKAGDKNESRALSRLWKHYREE